jgi:flagellar biosynthesis chaperone FliJ
MAWQDDAKKRFWLLKDQVDKIEGQLRKLHDERNSYQAQFEPKLRDMSKKIKKLTEDAKLAELKNEMGALARALKMQVGERPK